MELHAEQEARIGRWRGYVQRRRAISAAGVDELERWQRRYLPVYGVWAAIVVVVFPPVFA